MSKTAMLPLTNGGYAIVDADMFEELNKFKWRLSPQGYPARYAACAHREGSRSIYLHRVVNQTPDGMETDHINGIKTDCRRENLRRATRGQNACNQLTQTRPKSSRFKGVSLHTDDRHRIWSAHITVKNKKRVVGSFTDEVEAAKAYNRAAVEHFGEFAKLNPV